MQHGVRIVTTLVEMVNAVVEDSIIYESLNGKQRTN